jgi:hypothetical protein
MADSKERLDVFRSFCFSGGLAESSSRFGGFGSGVLCADGRKFALPPFFENLGMSFLYPN